MSATSSLQQRVVLVHSLEPFNFSQNVRATLEKILAWVNQRATRALQIQSNKYGTVDKRAYSRAFRIALHYQGIPLETFRWFIARGAKSSYAAFHLAIVNFKRYTDSLSRLKPLILAMPEKDLLRCINLAILVEAPSEVIAMLLKRCPAIPEKSLISALGHLQAQHFTETLIALVKVATIRTLAPLHMAILSAAPYIIIDRILQKSKKIPPIQETLKLILAHRSPTYSFSLLMKLVKSASKDILSIELFDLALARKVQVEIVHVWLQKTSYSTSQLQSVFARHQVHYPFASDYLRRVREFDDFFTLFSVDY